MNRPYFETQIKLLISDFGPTEFTSGKVSMIWEHCKDLPDENFGKIVKHFIETKSNKYPPLPTHFHEAAIEQRKLLERQGFGKTWRSGEATWSETPIKEIMKKLGGESAVEALEKQLQKNKGAV